MTPIEMAEALDEMERDILSWEADLLDFILKALRDGKEITIKQRQSLEAIYEKYLGEKDMEDEAGEASGETEPGESGDVW